MKTKILVLSVIILFLSSALCYANPDSVTTFEISLHDGETTISRVIDEEAGVVIWVANSKTFGLAVALAILPIAQTRLAKGGKFVPTDPQTYMRYRKEFEELSKTK